MNCHSYYLQIFLLIPRQSCRFTSFCFRGFHRYFDNINIICRILFYFWNVCYLNSLSCKSSKTKNEFKSSFVWRFSIFLPDSNKLSFSSTSPLLKLLAEKEMMILKILSISDLLLLYLILLMLSMMCCSNASI